MASLFHRRLGAFVLAGAFALAAIAGAKLDPFGLGGARASEGEIAPTSAATLERLAALRIGQMKKLQVRDAPEPLAQTGYVNAAGDTVSLADLKGKVVVLNFWATWCPPCLRELPTLDRLKAEMAGEDLAVLAVSVDRAPDARLAKAFADLDIAHLELDRDPKMELARSLALLGMPTTIVIDRSGAEVARLSAEAEWDSAEAKAVLEALMAR